MLPKANRITENREFLKIFKAVRPVHTAHLAIRVAERNIRTEKQRNRITNNQTMQQSSKLPSRFGFVVSNKIDKRSSRRNGLKRRIRAVIENNLSNIKPGVDVVIQVKNSFDFPYNFAEIEREVLEALAKAKLLNNQ